MGTGEGEERASVVPVILHSSFILHPSSHRCPVAERNDPADQVDCGAGADRHRQRGQVRAPASGSEPRPTQAAKALEPSAQLEFQSAVDPLPLLGSHETLIGANGVPQKHDILTTHFGKLSGLP